MPRIEPESNVGRALEQLVDSNSLASVLEALAQICYLKAEHLETNWQSNDSKVWLANGRRIAAVEAKCRI